MKKKKFVRIISLLMAILMVAGVLGSALSVLADAATIVKKKSSVHIDSQPDLTFYDLEGELIGTFSHAAKSDLIGFNSTRVIYRDEDNKEVEKNYSRVDVTLNIIDGTGKFSEMTSTRRDSYYLKYNMGSSTGEAFANRIITKKGKDDTIDLAVKLQNVVFRDSNEMKMNLIFQYPYTTKVSSTSKLKPKQYIKTHTATLNFTFNKAKLDLTVTKPKDKVTITDKDTGADKNYPPYGYGDKDALDEYLENKDKESTFDPDGNEIEGGDNNGSGDNNGTDGTTPPTDGDNNNGGNGGGNGGSTGGATPPDNDNGGTTPPNNALFETPYLLLEEYSTGGMSQIAAGNTFALEFTAVNTSQQIDLENIIVKIAPSEGLQIVDSSNVFYLPIVNKSDSFTKSVNISVLPNAEAKSHPIDVSFIYEYVQNNTRQKGEMSQQIAVQTVQSDRFSADPITGLMESSVGEEIYLTGKYVNKSRGEIYNLSATLAGEFNGAGQTNHIGNIAAGASGEVEFSFTPQEAGKLEGAIVYSYEDAAGNERSATVPFSTTIIEAPQMDMPTTTMPVEPMPEPPQEPTFLEQLKNPNSWQMWAAVGTVTVVVVIIAAKVSKKRKAAVEFEDDDENI